MTTEPSNSNAPLPPHLAQALERAGWVLFWERLRQRAWIPASILLLFIALGASGLLSRLPSEAHLAALAGFALSLAASLLYPDGGLLRLRFPSLHEQARRLEEQNALPHRPLRDWQDSPIGGDPILWREHRRRQLAALPSRLYAGEPRPALAGRDRYALRAAALLLALAALGITAAPFEELRRAITPFAAEAAGPTQLEIWLEPPTYTGRAPLYPDAAGAAFRPMETPQHSELVIRLQDTGGEPLLRLRSSGPPAGEAAVLPPAGEAAVLPPAGEAAVLETAEEKKFLILEDGRLEYRATLEADSEITLALPAEETPRRWRIAIVPDAPPHIAWNAPISFTYSGSLRVEYAAGDDYGITEAAALLERDFTEAENRNLPPPAARSPLTPTPLITLPLRPSPDNETHTEYHDLAAHPWAGLPVRMRLTAKDEAGQRRFSRAIAFQLPEVAFESPLARAFMEMRRRLALAPPVASTPPRKTEDDNETPPPPRPAPGEKGASLAPLRLASFEGVASFAPDVAASPGQKGRVGGQMQGGAWGGLPPKNQTLALGEEGEVAPSSAPAPEAAAQKEREAGTGDNASPLSLLHPSRGQQVLRHDVVREHSGKGGWAGKFMGGVGGFAPHMQNAALGEEDAPSGTSAQNDSDQKEGGAGVGETLPPPEDEVEWVIQALDALAKAPELYDLEASDFLHLRAAHWKLRTGATRQALRETRDLLWRMALRAESGMLPDIEERLRAAREALERALAEQAPEREIQELLERFQSVLNDYLREQARRDIARGQPSPLPNADSIDSRQLSDMLERIGELSGINAYEEARRLLSELAEILENLQFAAPTPEERALSRALQELQQIERQQQQLLDETHRQQQECPPGQTCPPPNAETARNLQALQQSLRDRLENLLSNMEADGVPAPDALQEGAQSMGDSAQDLGAGAFEESTGAQGTALQRLREGFDQLMRQGGGGQGGGVTAGQGEGRGRPGGPGSDPLGRNLGDSLSDTEEDIVPREIDPQWAREMRADILRRLGESWRSQTERNYLERLLRQADPPL